jgi:hypothetical protein
VGGVVSSNGGQASNIAGSAGGGVGGSAAVGGASGGGTAGANLAGVPNLAGAPGCPPPTAKPNNPAACPTNPDRQTPCNVDPALVCTYWEPTQLLCPQSGLFPTYLACCDHQWQIQPTLDSSCASSAGGDSAGGAAP